MSSHLTPTSELAAVNAMLESIGETKINSLENIEAPDADTALTKLRQVSRQVQAEGWHWNTDIERVLALDENSEIPLPANTLKVDTVGSDAGLDVVQRGTRLYDRVRHTKSFTKPVKADVVIMLDFDELPESARQYIFLRAGRMFQDGVVGAAALHRFQEKDEIDARTKLEAAEDEAADYNILTGNWGAMRVISRRVNPARGGY